VPPFHDDEREVMVLTKGVISVPVEAVISSRLL